MDNNIYYLINHKYYINLIKIHSLVLKIKKQQTLILSIDFIFRKNKKKTKKL